MPRVTKSRPSRAEPAEAPLAVVATGAHLMLGGIAVIAIILPMLWGFQSVWKRSILSSLTLQPGGWSGALVVVALSAVLHEGLHVLGWRSLGGTAWGSVSWRLAWRGLGLVALLNTPVSMSAYRTATALPTIILGLAVASAGLVAGIGLLVFWGLFFLFECLTDLALLFASRSVPPDTQVLSHPDQLGLLIASEA